MRFALAALSALVVLTAGLFTLNGLVLAGGRTPVAGVVDPASRPPARTGTVKILAWNIAKGFVHHGGVSFDAPAVVEARLRRIAAVVRRETPDFVFLSEVVVECAPCDVDQLRFLAEATGLRHWVFGENYNFGLPFLRVVGGNAILANRPIRAVSNTDLAGRRPFWVTRNNRRFLLGAATIAGATVHLGCMHTDSFDIDNNHAQTRQILDLTRDRPTILAGDFNATPADASLAAVGASGRFTGPTTMAPTFPAEAPDRCIDHVFAPAGWRLREYRVLPDRGSDHRAVVAVFAVR